MRIIPDKLMREALSISKQVPVYYVDMQVIYDAGQEREKQFNADENQEFMENFADYRPFDEVVIVVEREKRYELVHFLSDGTFRNFSQDAGMEITNQTIRERFAAGKMNVDEDRKRYEQNVNNARAFAMPFSVKKNVVAACEGRTYAFGRKNNSKKQRFLYVTSSVKESIPSGGRIGEVFQITSVAGHRRTFRKNPETRGHDRYGLGVVGWTWVRPYKKGDGEEIMTKIRLWTK